MYSAAVYNYFNSSRHTRKHRCRKGKIPIPKPTKTKQMNTCKSCGRKFFRATSQIENDAEIVKPPGNAVYEKFLLIWKYAKSFLSRTVRKQDHQKCSFKVIAHKSYKKRSLQKGLFKTRSSVLSQLYCQTCKQQQNEKNKCVPIEENKMNENVLHESKNKLKKIDKKKSKMQGKQYLFHKCTSDEELSTTEATETTQSDKYLRGKKRHIKLCTRSSRSSFQKKKPKHTIKTLKKAKPKKKTEKKILEKKPLLPKRKVSTNKKKRIFVKESKRKENRFSSWQYIQHALNSVMEDSSSTNINEDKTPVYLTFEEYCLILEAINTQDSSAERFEDTSSDLTISMEEVAKNTDTRAGQSTTIEDTGTNTDETAINTEDASTNTEQTWEFTEKVAINTKKIIDSIEELNEDVTSESNEDTEETNEINEEQNEDSKQLSEATETLDAVNDLLTEAIEEFETNANKSSHTTINIDISKADNKVVQNSSKDGEKPNSSQYSTKINVKNEETIDNKAHTGNNRDFVPNNSFVNINEQSHITLDPIHLCEEIEKIITVNGFEQT